MRLRITVEGVSYDVEVEVLDEGSAGLPPAQPSRPASAPVRPGAPAPPSPAQPAPSDDGEKVCRSPIAGTVLDLKVQPGDAVALNQVLMVLEAMKMEANIASPVEGTVRTVHVRPGDAVKQGQVLIDFD